MSKGEALRQAGASFVLPHRGHSSVYCTVL